MGALSKVLRSVADAGYGGQGGKGWFCPGCQEMHVVNLTWAFNDNPDAPAFAPSVLVTGLQMVHDASGSWTGEYVRDADGTAVEMRCHAFVGGSPFNSQPGMIQFLDDCTHALAGQTVPMVEQWSTEE